MDKKYLPGIIIFFAFFLIALYTINDYGVTWDEFSHFASGDAYIEYFKTGNLKIEQMQDLRFYGPLSDIIASLSYNFLTKKFHILNEIASHHLVVIIWASLAVLVTYFFMLKAYNQPTAIISALSLALFPRFVGHAHNNPKDLPVAAFFLFAVVAFWMAVERKSWKWTVLAAILLGAGFSIKINAIFVPVVLALWLLIGFRDKLKKVFRKDFLLYPFVALLATYLTWPWLWKNPITNFVELLKNFGGHGGQLDVLYFGKVYVAKSLPWHYPLVFLAIVTPLLILALAVAGFVIVFKQSKNLSNRTSILLLVWFLVTVGVVSFPGVVVYDGIRHFLTAVPAFCMIAGVGGGWFYNFVKEKWGLHWIVPACFFAVGFIIIFFAMVRVHPFEADFFNNLVGKAGGAQGKFEVEYWGSSYKQGCEWVNANAKQNAKVLLPPGTGGHLAMYCLRSDINAFMAGDEADYVMFITKLDFNPFPEAKPLYTVNVDGADILKVYDGKVLESYTP